MSTKKTIIEELQIPITEMFTVRVEFIARDHFEYWERRVKQEDLLELIKRLQAMADDFPKEKKYDLHAPAKEPMWGAK